MPPAAESPTLDPSAESFLLELIDTPAPSGYEEPAAALWRERAAGFASVRSDALGTSYATVDEGAGGRVALVGHVDEIGLIVTKIDDRGFLRVAEIGGWDVAVLVGQRVRILTRGGEQVVGSIGRGAVHQLDADARGKVPKLKDLWIDIGAADGDEARSRVSIGDPAVIDVAPVRLGEHRLMSRSLDDRIGAFVALEVARRSQGGGVEVVAVASTREENGGAPGAMTAMYSLQPQAAIAIDVTAPSDTPAPLDDGDFGLGKGPVIVRGASTSPAIVDELIAAAEGAGIDYQLRGKGRRTGTDADGMVKAGAGVAVGLVSIPCRYLHSPVEQVDLADVAAAIDLLTAWIGRRA